MRKISSLLLSLVLVSCASSPSSKGPMLSGDPTLSFQNETRITNLRQLTFEGTNAEAYWSYDGKSLTFQHSGEGAKCDQIFKMDSDGKNRVRISTGKGRTTCSFFYPKDDFILFSSTHASSLDCPPEPDKAKTYAWPVYPSYQFYRAKPDGTDVLPIEPGAPSAYNAEMVTCRDGKVIFTSDRGGDLDLYVGRLGSRGMLADVKQVTNTLGYDGGAFFSQDCSKIVWRASRPKPGKEAKEYIELLEQHLVKPSELEIWTASADGSNARQVTKLGGASFAPYFDPDGEHILFASNFQNPKGRAFNIYRVRTNGTELEQITFSGTFDSFPMFSPDGRYLAFSSNRNARKPRETNVFVADWNGKNPGPILTDDESNAVNRWYVVARELSSPDMEGRALGTEGLKRAETYVAELFGKAGLKDPASVFGLDEIKGFEHEIEIVRGVEIDEKETAIKADWKDLKLREDFAPASFSSSGAVAGRMVDVGYGIVAPELGIDDYEGKIVRGRIALVRRRVPSGLSLKPSQEATYSDLRYKAFLARERGAAGVVFWDAEAAADQPEDLMASVRDAGKTVASDAGIPAFFASKKVVGAWLASKKPVGFTGKIALSPTKVPAANIVGALGDADRCSKRRAIVIGAHMDHLGTGAETSLEPGSGRVHPGADDNASGVATLVEVARKLKTAKDGGCYLFAAFTGEESGVLGSSKFVDLLRKKGVRVKAMLNMDMVGRMNESKVTILGAKSAEEWKPLIKNQCEQNALQCSASGDGYGPSDQMPFYLARIPVLQFFTGVHGDYHRSTDTIEKLNPVGGVQIADLVAGVAMDAFDYRNNLTWVKAAGAESTSVQGRGARGDARGSGAYLGTIPVYGEAKAIEGAPKGVALSGVREKSPASEGGVREGDVITGAVVLDSEPGTALPEPRVSQIQSLQDYSYVLQNLKPGMRIKLQAWRQGRTVELPVTVGRKGGNE
jgi:Tol biopolymer transport system component